MLTVVPDDCPGHQGGVHLRTTNPIEPAFAHLVALVRAGARVERGALAGCHDQQGRAV
jgi:hypothetical protein